MRYFLGIDLGGTNIAIGLVDETYRIAQRSSVRTDLSRGLEAMCDDIAALCYQALQTAGVSMEDVVSAGIGSPGIIWDGMVVYANNLNLRNAPLSALLAERLGLPVQLCGDGNAAAYGEYVAGVGKGCRSLVALTIGTGIGGGVIMNGKTYSGFNGAAPELGHMIIRPGGRLCTCGRKGCLEAYCSATGLIHSTKLAMQERPESEMWRLSGGVDQVSGKTSFDAMRLGDGAAIALVDAYLDDMALGVANVINLLQPEVLCVGGGVSKEGNAIIVPLREKVEALTFAGCNDYRTKIAAAALGNDAGIIGAALLGTGPS